MPDREKVIEGLEYCTGNHLCSDCGYYDPDNARCQKDLMRDALELLKEQEAVKPILVKLYPHDVYKCGNCGHCAVGTTVPKTYRPKYCPECGKAVKWDD